MTNPPALVVFSDLDGTLLDHETYDWTPAKPALDRLARQGCPVILSSSKTAAEISVLQDAMGLSAYPAIVENGAGLMGMDGQASSPCYDDIRARLDDLPKALRAGFRGFGDMTLEDLRSVTGLQPDAASLAKQRSFSEPGLWSGTDAERLAFVAALEQRGLKATQGGRFLTLSFGASKADGMAQILSRFQPEHSLALGDAPNDIEMLNAADFGVIVANPHRQPLEQLPGEADGRIRRTIEAGPSGWNGAVCDLLDQLGQD